MGDMNDFDLEPSNVDMEVTEHPDQRVHEQEVEEEE
jgi:hypothetical protein